MTWVMWNLTSFNLETMLVSVQDRCIIYARCTIVSEVILDAPMVLIGDKAQVEAWFGMLGISTNLGER